MCFIWDQQLQAQIQHSEELYFFPVPNPELEEWVGGLTYCTGVGDLAHHIPSLYQKKPLKKASCQHDKYSIIYPIILTVYKCNV